MTTQEKQYQIIGNFSEMISVTKLLLGEFKKVHMNIDIKKNLPTVEGVYMYTIVMHLGKIFSTSKNEKFSLYNFKTNFSGLDQRVDSIYSRHKNIIGKIKNNRDKLFAHTDRDFAEMGYSQIYIDNLNRTYGTDFSRMRASHKEYERYTPNDLDTDENEITEMMDTTEGFWKDVLMSINS